MVGIEKGIVNTYQEFCWWVKLLAQQWMSQLILNCVMFSKAIKNEGTKCSNSRAKIELSSFQNENWEGY